MCCVGECLGVSLLLHSSSHFIMGGGGVNTYCILIIQPTAPYRPAYYGDS